MATETHQTVSSTDRVLGSDERFIDAVEHPAAHAEGRTLPAGKVILVVVLALVTAALFNSRAMVRAGNGMPDGLTRTLVLGVAEPVDGFARALYLDKPREGLDALFGNRSTTDGGEELLSGSADILAGPRPVPGSRDVPAPAPSAAPSAEATPSAPAPAPAPPPGPTVRSPSAEAPLRVLVTGDSLASYVGAQITNITAGSGRTQVATKEFNGTGLTRPEFFNWQANAEQQIAEQNPEVVVMVLGGNDGWNMKAPDGANVSWGSQPWIDEYARRTAVVMQTYAAGGQRQVYWSGPPTARDGKWNGIYQQINQAVARAAQAIPGAHFVDLYTSTAVNGGYSDYVPIDGQNVLSRQSDGVHFSYDGSVLPARLVLQAMESEFGGLT